MAKKHTKKKPLNKKATAKPKPLAAQIIPVAPESLTTEDVNNTDNAAPSVVLSLTQSILLGLLIMVIVLGVVILNHKKSSAPAYSVDSYTPSALKVINGSGAPASQAQPVPVQAQSLTNQQNGNTLQRAGTFNRDELNALQETGQINH